ncbi:MAG: hypothetical protein AB7G12_10310 [Thermoanaerobaculia bacterium]
MSTRIEIPLDPANPRATAEAAIELCKSGDWSRGLSVLADLVKERGLSDSVPGIAYSYLGYGIARYEKKVKEGRRLCEHAVKVQFYNPDCHLNLARVCLLARNRKRAVLALSQGLALDPKNEGLRALHAELGIRKRPVVGFLDRSNPVNKTLGRIRHGIKEDS